MSDRKTMLESLAATQHDIWSHWMEYLFSVSESKADGSVTIPSDKVKRWRAQMHSDYSDLSESEKRSDRDQAEKILDVMADYLGMED